VHEAGPNAAGPSRHVGIADVAAAAGVSATTVSHALNGRGQVSAETRSRVLQVAADLGYAPNRIASALRRKRSGIVGFVSDEIATTPYAGRVVLGAQDAAATAGALLWVVNSNRDAEIERVQIEALIAQRVDAIVYAKMFHQHASVPPALRGTHTVLVDIDADGAPTIVPDEFGTGVAATRALLEAGHRRIAHLTVAEPTPAKSGRLAGYLHVLAEAGLDPLVAEVRVESSSPTATTTARPVADRLLAESAPTAVFCFNDQLAMGLYQAAQSRGVEIPRELSVIGVDDLELIAPNLVPPLSTLALPHYEMGRWAVETALRLVDEGRAPDADRTAHPEPPLVVPTRFVARESVAAPRADATASGDRSTRS
jgi:LacI family transcriptional regulator